jgi:hypothetical protein
MSGNEESAAPDQPARCWLVSSSTLAGATYKEAATANLSTLSNFKPSLAVDVGEDTISVMDANTNALVASAPLAQVTATPATRLGAYRVRRYAPKGVPILVVCVPGAQRLTIGCQQHSQGSGANGVYHFWWHDTVPQEKNLGYFACGERWLTLVEKLGLAPQLGHSQPRPGHRTPWYQQPRGQKVLRWVVVGWLAFCVVFVVTLIILGVVFHQF